LAIEVERFQVKRRATPRSRVSFESTDKLGSYAFATMRRFNPKLLQLAARTPPSADGSAYDLP
jgi:hypothetical protein